MERISTYLQNWQTRVLDFLRYLQAPLRPSSGSPGSNLKDLDLNTEPFVLLQANRKVSSTGSPAPQLLLNRRINSPTTRSRSNSWRQVNNTPEESTESHIFPTQTDECDEYESESATPYSTSSRQSQQSSISSVTPPDKYIPFSYPIFHRRPINYLRSSLHPSEVISIFETLSTSRRFPLMEKLIDIIPDPYTAPLPPDIFQCPSELEDLYSSWLETRDLMWTEMILVESGASFMSPSLRNQPDWLPNTMPIKAIQLSRLLPRINVVLGYLVHEASEAKLGRLLKELELNRHNQYIKDDDHPYTLIRDCLDYDVLHVYFPLYPGLQTIRLENPEDTPISNIS